MKTQRPAFLTASALTVVLALGACGSPGGGGAGDASQAGGSDASGGFNRGDGVTIGSEDSTNGPGRVGEVAGADADVGEPSDTTQPDLLGAEDVASSTDVQGPEVGTPKVAVDPASYTFSYISPLSQVLTRQISIFNTGTASLTVTKVSMVPGGSPDFGLIAVPPLPKVLHPGEYTLALARFQEIAGSGSAILRVESTDPNHPTVDVLLDSYKKATVGGSTPNPDACVELLPPALNFGNVKRGDTKVLSTVLKNCSSEVPLTLSAITRSSFFIFPLTEEMQVVPMPALPSTIPPGGSIPVSVAYTPLLAGPDSGYFGFKTNDPAEPEAKLDVSGNGTEPPPEEIGLTIKLSWNSNLCDVDSHLLQPGGTFFDCVTDCYFGNPSPEWGAKPDWQDNPYLDVDDVDGFGPEHTNISEPQAGKYRFIVHYYDDGFEGSSPTETDATVEVFSYGAKVAEFGPQHLDVTNRTWDVFDIDWPSATVTPLGSTNMTNAASGAFCIPSFP